MKKSKIIIKTLSFKKPTGPDKIPVKIVKMTFDITHAHLAITINNDLLTNSYSDSAKLAPDLPSKTNRKEQNEKL